MPSFDPSDTSYQESASVFSAEEDRSDSHLSPNNQPQRKSAILRILVIFGMIALVLGPIVVLELPSEIARWFLAAAIEKYRTGDNPAAYELLTKAIDWDPESGELLLQRAKWQLEENKPQEALEDLNEVLRLQPKLAQGFLYRSLAQQRLGNHSAALADLEQLVKHAQDEYFPIELALNAKAYGQAIAIDDQALDISKANEALADVEQALKKEQFNEAYLDTRGFLYFLLEKYEPALEDLNQAVKIAEEKFETYISAAEQSNIVQPALDRYKKDLEESLAVMYHHRHRIYEKIGQKKKSESDRKKALKLGYNPAEGVR